MQSLKPPQERRWKRLSLNPEIMLHLYFMEALHPGECLVRHKFTNQNQPDGMQLVRCGWSDMYMCVDFVFYHDDWPIIPNGEVIPDLDVKDYPTEIHVFQVTNETKIIPYVSTPFSNFMNLPKMI